MTALQVLVHMQCDGACVRIEIQSVICYVNKSIEKDSNSIDQDFVPCHG